MTPERALERPEPDLLRRLALRRGGLTGIVAVVLAAMLLPALIEIRSFPVRADTLWILPVVAVAVLAQAWGWRGALSAMLANMLIFFAIQIWPLRDQIASTPASASETLPLLAMSLLVSSAVAWMTIHHSESEQVRRLTEAHLRSAEQARAALAESEERYRRIVATSQDGIWEVDRDNVTTFVNAKMAALLGYTVEEVLGRSTFEFLPDASRELLRSRFERRRRGITENYEITLRRKDGTEILVLFSAAPYLDADGRMTGALTTVTDVTESRRIEAQLREAEARYRQLVEQLPAVVYTVGVIDSTALRYISPRVEELTGYDRAAFDADPELLDLITHPDDAAGKLAAIADANATLAPLSLDYRIIHRDGHTIWLRDESVVIFNEEGRPLFAQGVLFDVTERKRVEDSLRQSEERFRGAFDDAGSPMTITAMDGRFLQVNDALCAMLGYTRQELLDRSFPAVTVSEDADRQWELVNQIISGERRSFQLEKRYIHKAGHYVHAIVTVSAIHDADGRPAYNVVHIQDITARKQAEEALRQSEERFRGAFDDAGGGASITNLGGYFTRVNQAMCAMLGYSEQELLGRHFRDVTLAEDQDRQAAQGDRVANGDLASFSMEKRYLHKDGHIVHGVVTVSAINDAQGRPEAIVSHVQDITARKLAETALRESEERFRAAIEGSMDAFHMLRAVRDASRQIIDFELVDMNTRGAQFLNVRRDDALGRRARELFPDYYSAGFFEKYVRIVESGQPVENEFPDPTPGFEGVWLRHQIVPLSDGLAITSRDITDQRRAEQALRESEERFRAAAEGSIDAFYVARALRDAAGEVVDFEIVEMNSRAEAFLRVEREQVLGKPISKFFPTYRETGFFAKYLQVIESGEPFEEELADPTPGFEGAWLHHQIIPLADGVAVTSRDITGRREIENALRESEERFRSAFANAVTGMARVAPDGRFLEVNPAFSTMFGFADYDLSTRTLLDLAHPDDRMALGEQVRRLTAGESQAVQVEGRYYNRQAHLLWGLLGASVIRDRDGAPLYLICQIQDITARKEQEQRLLRQAQHDALTSLPNRLLFMERLQRALNGAHQRGESIGVMYLDLDGFKSVNDTFGHLVGDQLLAEVGKRLSRCIRGGDTVARLGGDEFSIIVGSVLDQETATRIAARVIEEFTRPFTVGTASVTVGVSIGISFSAPAHTDPDTLLHEADVALYQAKAAGKRRFVVYRRDLTPEQEDQLLAERTTDWRAPATRSDEG